MAVNTRFRLAEREERATRAIATGTGIEVIGAGAGIVLSILALVGILPGTLAAVALIVLGASVLFESLAIGKTGVVADHTEAVGGLSVGTLTAVAAIALGILALLGIMPAVLLAIGVITIGACGIFSSSEMDRLGHFTPVEVSKEEALATEAPVFRAVGPASGGLELMSGIGAVVLGILALVGVNPAIMVLTGLLVISAGMFLSSAAVTGRMAKFLRS